MKNVQSIIVLLLVLGFDVRHGNRGVHGVIVLLTNVFLELFKFVFDNLSEELVKALANLINLIFDEPSEF